MATSSSSRPAPPRPVSSKPSAPRPGSNSTVPAAPDTLSSEASNFPPIYEAAILYSADYYEACLETLREYLKTQEGRNSLRAWLMLFDYYQITGNRTEFDALSMLFTVKFERSPPAWIAEADSGDPRRKEKRERKDFFALAPSASGGLLQEIEKFEAFARELGSSRLDFSKVKQIHSDEASLFTVALQRLRRDRIPLWFNGLDEFAALLKKCINDANGRPMDESQGFWELSFELYIHDGRLDEYEELGLEYAVSFEMSPPAWEPVSRPSGQDDAVATTSNTTSDTAAVGFPLKGVLTVANREELHQLSAYAASNQEVVVDMSALLRVDFNAVGMLFETIRSIHLSQKRVILSNVNELVASLIEVFGVPKHAILMRKKTA